MAGDGSAGADGKQSSQKSGYAAAMTQTNSKYIPADYVSFASASLTHASGGQGGQGGGGDYSKYMSQYAGGQQGG